MTKIENALTGKADSSVCVLGTLLASAWAGEDAPYIQELVVEGLTSEQNGSIAVAHSATAEQMEMARNAVLSVAEQADGKLVITAEGEKPNVDIPVFVILLG